jgi:ABC-2 type transport system ATP-binding protein
MEDAVGGTPTAAVETTALPKNALTIAVLKRENLKIYAANWRGFGVGWSRYIPVRPDGRLDTTRGSRAPMTDDIMIEVANLTKRYAGKTAVEDVSFTVGRGEIVGLLGPNGAGKSTTMRILSCFMPATSGLARVAGLDVATQADEVRRRIGYMPENNPLHQDMRVREYLKFRARLKGLGMSRARERADAVIAQCGLADASRRIIGQLSKGYRQRVGLADALVHEPDLIILDEPTIGLDPSQIRAVRQLIKDLGRRHTVLLSSHILPEVELTCNRVVIMREGRILAADTPENLQNGLSGRGQVIAEIAAPLADLKSCWDQMAEIGDYEIEAAQGEYLRCSLTAANGGDLRPLIFELAAQRGWKLRELSQRRYSLEDIYIRLTRPQSEEESS